MPIEICSISLLITVSWIRGARCFSQPKSKVSNQKVYKVYIGAV